MNSTESVKLAGAFLGTVFLIMTVGIISNAIFSTHSPEKPGYIIQAAETSGGGEKAASAEPAAPEPVSPLLASADVGKGEKISKKCHACHNLEKGAGAKVGPDLWNIVGREPGSVEGFNYSSAMKDFGQKHKEWTYEELNHFLTAPKKYISGTAMGFAGISKLQDRADLIAYLRTLSDNPVPLPQ